MSSKGPMWAATAYRLWRRHWSYAEISDFLALEGWAIPPARIEAVCLGRAEVELARLGVRIDRAGT